MIWVFNGRKKKIKKRKRKILKRLVGDGIIFILGVRTKKISGKKKVWVGGKSVVGRKSVWVGKD